MSEQTIISIISGLLSVIAVLGLVIKTTLDKKSNGNGIKSSNGIQTQITSGAEGTKALANRFDEQVSTCNKLWLDNAEFRGEMKGYMVEIRDKLKWFESK